MALERRTWARLATGAILVLVFGAGVLLGLAWERRLDASPVARAPWTPWGERRDRGPEGRTLIIDRVGLSEHQKATVDSVVDFHRGRMAELQREFRGSFNPRYWAIVDSTRESIKAVLTAEQAVLYDSLLAEHDRRRGRGEPDDTRD